MASMKRFMEEFYEDMDLNKLPFVLSIRKEIYEKLKEKKKREWNNNKEYVEWDDIEEIVGELE